MDWIGVSWEIAINIIEATFFSYLLTQNLHTNQTKKPYLLIGIILRIVWISFLNFTVFSATITLILLLFYDIIFTVLFFDNSISEKLLWGSNYVIIALLADKFTFWIANTFTDYDLKDLVLIGKVRFIMSLVYLLICMILVITLANWKKKNFFLPIHLRIILVLLICLGTIASDQLLNLIIWSDFKHMETAFISRMEGISFIFLFILFGFIIFIEYLGIVSQQNENLRKKNILNELEKKHYQTINTTILALRNWRHDYKTHLQVILNLVECKKYDDLSKFVTQLEAELTRTTRLVSTGNSILDALLSVKILEMKKENIDLSYEIYLTPILPFENISFASLIGNLLENAINACRTLEESQKRYIKLSIKPYQEMLYINIENSATGHYSYSSDGSLKSNKKGAEHGIGLKRVQEIINQVNGFCSIYPESDKFKVTIMAPIPNTEGGETSDNKSRYYRK